MAGGCANVKPTRSAYLSDYSRLQTVPNNDNLEIRRVSAFTLDDVDSFYIEDVAATERCCGRP
jgi:hypothetical protein